MTPELFMQWKQKKIEERDANLAEQQAERAKNDRMRYTPSFHSLAHVILYRDIVYSYYSKIGAP